MILYFAGKVGQLEDKLDKRFKNRFPGQNNIRFENNEKLFPDSFF